MLNTILTVAIAINAPLLARALWLLGTALQLEKQLIQLRTAIELEKHEEPPCSTADES